MLDKHFNPADIEEKYYGLWEQEGLFKADPSSDRPPFTVMMPPPNVTGTLHMGHALNMSLQDFLIRYWRRKGYDALWQPGTDHAGIATQMVVERALAEEGTSRRALGREAFLQRVWDWKNHSNQTIGNQLRRLGVSCDWSRERFTMDDGLSQAVLKVFIDLYRQGLIYRDQRLVNWDPKFGTAISDLEVVNKEEAGHLWHFRYPLEAAGKDASPAADEGIVVATTRPETMLGDTAVAVHPEDARYQHLIGRHVILPLVGRRIPIIADEYADPEAGSGAVKITPAHDFNDFEVGRRHDLEVVNILDETAHLNEAVPAAYRGLDRFTARERVVADLDAQGALVTIEAITHTVPYGDRSDVVIEPWLTVQWFVDAKTMARPAIEAVERGDTRFVPDQWTKVYFDWMRNIQPWCISRQLWWGHRIPAWYGPDGAVFVAADGEEADRQASAHYGRPVELKRDEDVLDTWFSSALWPFSTLGWPEGRREVERYYPGDVLVTGFDIIFFWVARMMMMGLHFMGDVPFRTVVIHALVRDAKGQKMSKSKGNALDPLDLVNRYGADATRFALAVLAAPGRDIKLSESRVEGMRNFTTKLWNAARYAQMNDVVPRPDFDPATVTATVNRWIVGETVVLHQTVEQALGRYRFNEAAQAIYQFTWGTFCDWYVEFSKPILTGEDSAAADETRATMAWVLDQILHHLNPFMPFLSEEVYQRLAGEHATRPRRDLMVAPWPALDPSWRQEGAEAEMNAVVRFITTLRGLRSEMNVPAGSPVDVILPDASADQAGRLRRHQPLIERLAKVSALRFVDEQPAGAVETVFDGARVVVPLAELIDVARERARLEREVRTLDQEIAKIDKKLDNADFLTRAPEAVVEEQRERRRDMASNREKLGGALDRLSRMSPAKA